MSIRRRHAFTLVELLVVISIISLLIAVLLPALRKARETSSSVICLSNQRQVTQVLLLYTGDWKETLPPHMIQSTTHVPGLARLALGGYMKELDTVASTPTRRLANPGTRDIRLCPSMDGNPLLNNNTATQSYAHYLMSLEVTGYYNGVNWATYYPAPPTLNLPLKLTHAATPHVTMTVADTYIAVASGIGYQSLGMHDSSTGAGLYRGLMGMRNSGAGITNARWRHYQASTNFAFIDGHAETRKWNPDDPYNTINTVNWAGGFGRLLGTLRGRKYD